MRSAHDPPDLADPAVRAARALARRRRAEEQARGVAVLVLVAAGLGLPVAVAVGTGADGPLSGAVLLGLLLLALAVAVAPIPWRPAEERHRELEAIWRELRPDADDDVPWERCAAWAESAGAAVDLVLVTCTPAAERAAGPPSPYDRRPVGRIDAGDVAAAAQAMEELRAEAAARERAARLRVECANERAERRSRERDLAEVDAAAEADLRAREEQLDRELAAQEDAERRAQAEAVARALRRP